MKLCQNQQQNVLNMVTINKYSKLFKMLENIAIIAAQINKFEPPSSFYGIHYDVVCTNGAKCVFVYQAKSAIIIETGNTKIPYFYNRYLPNNKIKFILTQKNINEIPKKFIIAINNYLVTNK